MSNPPLRLSFGPRLVSLLVPIALGFAGCEGFETGSGGAGASSSIDTTGTGTGTTVTSTGSTGSTVTGSNASTGAGPGCGDGQIQDPEECDDGPDNGPGMACNAECKLNVCGDGDMGPTEGCDDGAANALALDACAPDCSKVIDKKYIIVSTTMTTPNFNHIEVGHADSLCPPSYKALFSFGLDRRATTTANQSVSPLDWVLTPYTAYTNSEGEVVWITDDVPLLGIRSGSFQSLEATIATAGAPIITGMNADWTTLTANSCNGWFSTSSSFVMSYGYSFYEDTRFLNTASTATHCDAGMASVYCIQQ